MVGWRAWLDQVLVQWRGSVSHVVSCRVMSASKEGFRPMADLMEGRCRGGGGVVGGRRGLCNWWIVGKVTLGSMNMGGDRGVGWG